MAGTDVGPGGGALEDRELLAAHVAGDPEAFGILFSRHRDRLWAVALRTTGDPEEAADALQDGLVSAFRRADSFRGDAAVTTWLHRIVVNACRDHHRRRRSFHGMTQKLAVLAGLSRGPDGRDLHDRMWLESAVSRLKPAYRDTVVLVAGQQLTHAEAAEILGIAEATVSWRMHEVRRLLGLA